MRRITALLASIFLVSLVFTGTALGARPDRFSASQTVVFCELISDDGTAMTLVASSDEFGTYGYLVFWASPTGPETDPPTWISGGSVVLIDGGSLMAEFEMFEYLENDEDPFGEPVGMATMTATLTPAGDPVTYRYQDHYGNATQIVHGTQQELSVAGTLELPEGIGYDLSSCMAIDETFSAFLTHPASGISHSTQLELGCFWETADGFVSLFAHSAGDDMYADIFIVDPSGEYFGFNAATFTTAEFAAAWELFPARSDGELEAVGSAEAAASLSPGDRINDRFTFGQVKVHVTGQGYEVDGALSLTTPHGTQELAMDGLSCSAADARVTQHFNPSQGGGGKPLPNDTPDTALPIAVGDVVEVQTGGTDVAPEAPCIINDEVEVPVGHTAWWTVQGTGGDVTVDTAGSDFDTVVGIYTDDGAGGYAQVACVDDVDSLQARVTFATDSGVTYYIQAGGFADSSGTLVLSVS